MPLSDWMADYRDRTLGNMILPGAHDAGTAVDHVDYVGLGREKNSATQLLTMPQMLDIGTRFFDLRLASKGNKVVAQHTSFKQGAFAKDDILDVMYDISEWCKKHPAEVVVIRVSHTKSGTNVGELIRRSCAIGNTLHAGRGNLATKTLSQICADGNLICVLDEKEFGKVIDQSQGLHAFRKYKGGEITNGLMTCGCYSGTHSLDQVICNGLKGQYEHNEKHGRNCGNNGDHLWQVYWQKTYLNPWASKGIVGGTNKELAVSLDKKGNAQRHGGTHAATSDMIKLMAGLGRLQGEDYAVAKTKSKGIFSKKSKIMYSTLDTRLWCLPNIISYDFVEPGVNQLIVDMNLKGVQGYRDEEAAQERELWSHLSQVPRARRA